MLSHYQSMEEEMCRQVLIQKEAQENNVDGENKPVRKARRDTNSFYRSNGRLIDKLYIYTNYNLK